MLCPVLKVLSLRIWMEDFVSFTMPGHPQAEPLVIGADFFTDDDGAAASTFALKNWLNAYVKANENKFQKENRLGR